MPRFAVPITIDEFKSKCDKTFGINSEDGFDPYELPPTIQKDLGKVNFDFENWDIGNAHPSYEKYPTDHQGFNNYPVGYQTLPNGLPVLFVNAGGDWEYPICFCIYWDGKKMRAYIPEDGNIYNKKEKCAYGSEDDFDDETEHEDLPEGDPEKIYNDVMNRIQIK